MQEVDAVAEATMAPCSPAIMTANVRLPRCRSTYVGGRLTLEELSDRTGRVLAARSRAEIRRALGPCRLSSRIPAISRLVDGRSWSRLLAGAMLVVFTGAYLVFSFVLLLVFGLTLLLNGASGTALVGFLLSGSSRRTCSRSFGTGRRHIDGRRGSLTA